MEHEQTKNQMKRPSIRGNTFHQSFSSLIFSCFRKKILLKDFKGGEKQRGRERRREREREGERGREGWNIEIETQKHIHRHTHTLS